MCTNHVLCCHVSAEVIPSFAVLAALSLRSPRKRFISDIQKIHLHDQSIKNMNNNKILKKTSLLIPTDTVLEPEHEHKFSACDVQPRIWLGRFPECLERYCYPTTCVGAECASIENSSASDAWALWRSMAARRADGIRFSNVSDWLAMHAIALQL